MIRVLKKVIWKSYNDDESYFLDIDKKNFAAYFNLQRLDEDLITNETIKYINQEIKNEKNLKNKNIAYGHFVLAKNYRKKKNIKHRA